MQELFNELKNYQGRFSRTKYWLYHIGINIFASIFLHLIDIFPNVLISFLFLLLATIPSMYFLICTQIKRSHDLGKSGNFVWLTLIPIINLYPLFMFAFIKGTSGDNEYGSDPVV